MTDTHASPTALIVVGMNAEARIASRLGPVRVGARGLDTALAAQPPSVVISFGLCGGLEPGLAVGDLLVGTSVLGAGGAFQADPIWTGLLERRASARAVLIAGTNSILASTTDKAALRARTGAGAADMESEAVAEAASRAGVAFAVLRAVSDGALDALPRSAIAGFRADGRPDIAAVLLALAARPWELPALIRTGANAQAALRALAWAADRVAEALADPS